METKSTIYRTNRKRISIGKIHKKLLSSLQSAEKSEFFQRRATTNNVNKQQSFKMWCIVNLPNGTQQAVKWDPKAIGQECLEKVGSIKQI